MCIASSTTVSADAFKAMLGDTLQTKDGTAKVETLAGKYVMLYFSAHWCPPCRGFTPQLATFYKAFKGKREDFEIVFVSSDRDENSFTEYFGEMPWMALPFSDRDRKDKLSKKFKVQGIPSLVVLSPDGKTITTDGRSAVSSDPEGAEFPWAPKPFWEIFGETFVNAKEEDVKIDDFKGKPFGIYFSAHWCPPCRGFTPKLIETYNKLKAANKDFEIVFASSDRDEESFKDYFKDMPWLALPYSDRKRKEELSKFCDVDGIPSLVIFDGEGKVITSNGRGAVSADPEGEEFPWLPKALNELTGDTVDVVNEQPALIVFTDKDGEDSAEFVASAKAALQPTADRYFASAQAKKGDECDDNDEGLAVLYATTDDIVQAVRKFAKVDENVRMMILDVQGGKKWLSDVAQEGITLDTVAEFVSKWEKKELNEISFR